MKKYSYYSDELSGNELFIGLVGYGLFAEKIPSFLSSEDFLAYVSQVNAIFNVGSKDYVRYNNMRNINIPRPMAIPEPFAYANQCRCLAQNWPEIQKYFREKTANDGYKVSRIHLRKMKDRAELFEMNYKNFSKDGDPEQDVLIRSKYVVSADISTCFPSIYTHSIPWALIGKATAKNRRDKKEWFNELDVYTRNVKHGETNGLLIGPHSSNLLSEVILVAVDFQLSAKGFKYLRNIDDYTCFVESHEQGEKFLLTLSDELRKFELSLNTKKSKITSLPKANVKNWVTKLNHFNFVNAYTKQTEKGTKTQGLRVRELKGFLDFAIELMLENESDASVLNYAIKTVANKYLGRNATSYYIKQIHHLSLLYPYLITLLEDQVFGVHSIDKTKIREIAIDVYELGMKKNLYQACSFSIYWSFKYDFNLGLNSLKSDSTTSLDCIFMLLSYLYDSKHNKRAYLKEYVDCAKELKNTEFDRYWIFIYEVLPWTELSDHYRVMKKQSLTFVKSEFR